MKRPSIYVVSGFFIVLLAAVFLLYPILNHEPGVPRVKIEIRNIAYALRQYGETYKELPVGNESDIVRALFGSNAQGVVFLYVRTNNLGEPLDPWNTAYRFEIKFTSQTNFLIQSAGENQIFGDGDDYALDYSKSEFAQEPKR